MKAATAITVAIGVSSDTSSPPAAVDPHEGLDLCIPAILLENLNAGLVTEVAGRSGPSYATLWSASLLLRRPTVPSVWPYGPCRPGWVSGA